MIHNESFSNPLTAFNAANTRPKPDFSKKHYAAFAKIKHDFAAADFGNRCGHRPNFERLSALKRNGQKIKLPHLLRKTENQIFYFFKQNFKYIFAKCPQLKIAHQTKTGRMRSEKRESLALTCAAIARNTDLATLAVKKERTVTEIYRFIAHALEAEGKGRRTSPDRIFSDLKLLADAGLIHYRKPSATRLEGDKWQAAAAEIAFTKKFWALIKIENTDLKKAKNEALAKQNKNMDKNVLAVNNRRIARLAAQNKRKMQNDAAKLTANTVKPLQKNENLADNLVKDFEEIDAKLQNKIRTELFYRLRKTNPDTATEAALAAWELTAAQGKQAVYKLASQLGLIKPS